MEHDVAYLSEGAILMSDYELPGRGVKVSSLGGWLDHLFGRNLGKHHESRSQRALQELLEHARKKVIIVTGEFDNSFYAESIGAVLAERIRCGLSDIEILLKEKVSGDEDKSIQILVSKNYQFFRSLYDGLKKAEQPELALSVPSFFFSRDREEKHFSVLDKDVFIESYHEAGDPRSVYIKTSTRYLANKYNKDWESIKNRSDVYKVDSQKVINAFSMERKKRAEG